MSTAGDEVTRKLLYAKKRKYFLRYSFVSYWFAASK